MSKHAPVSFHVLTAGALAGFVGFAAAFAVVLRGLVGVGASQAEAASGLMAVTVAMGLCGILLSLKTRMPISVAWSTPGAALLATTGAVEGGFPVAVGAFIVSGVLIVLAGSWKPLGRWVAAIPAALANAMLAGVLLGLCLAPVKAVGQHPAMGLAIVVTWAVVAKVKRLLAVPAAVIVTLGLIAASTPISSEVVQALWPRPVLVTPVFSLPAVIGIAIPLFIVTMASQNIPGMAVLHLNGYRPDAGPLFRWTGIFTLLSAPFGGHAVNLAAITAALCAGPDAHPDPARRYWASIVAGSVYVVLGLLAGAATAFISASPPILIEAVAGLALLGAFGSSLLGAVTAPEDREAAIVTFVVTASGLSFFGISGAFWGLVAGGAILALTRWKRPAPAAKAAVVVGALLAAGAAQAADAPVPFFAQDFAKDCAADGLPDSKAWRISANLDRALWADRVRCGVRNGDLSYLRIKAAPNDAYDPNPGNSPTERVEIQARRELVQFDHPVWYAFRFRLEAPWVQGAVENRTVIHQVKQNIIPEHEVGYGGECPAANPFFKIEAGYSTAVGAPGFVVKVRGTESCHAGANRTICGPWPLQVDAWHQVHVALKPTQRDGDSDVRVWLDGRPCPAYRGILGFLDFGKRDAEGKPFVDTQPRFGIYRDVLPGAVQAIDFADLRFWDADPTGDPRWASVLTSQ